MLCTSFWSMSKPYSHFWFIGSSTLYVIGIWEDLLCSCCAFTCMSCSSGGVPFKVVILYPFRLCWCALTGCSLYLEVFACFKPYFLDCSSSNSKIWGSKRLIFDKFLFRYLGLFLLQWFILIEKVLFRYLGLSFWILYFSSRTRLFDFDSVNWMKRSIINYEVPKSIQDSRDSILM